jgi:hypothetical protein
MGKGAQTGAISQNVEASNLWAFYQAKAIRRTTLVTAAEVLKSAASLENNPAAKEQIDAWNKTAARYASEPEMKEGTKELAERAKVAEDHRDTSMAKYHNFR